MRIWKLKLPIVLVLFFSNYNLSNAQSCVPTNINGTSINLLCNQTCTTMVFKVPHIKSTDDYVVNSIPYTPYPYQSGTVISSIYIDDKFSNSIPLTFPFCFYGATYTSCVIGSNGVLTFDLTNANGSNAWPLTTSGGSGTPIPIPYAGGSQGSISPAYYPKASIMGPYHDIYPPNSNGGQRRIEYSIVGTAPCRKFIASFYQVPLFDCETLVATHQIVLNESTGLIETYIGDKPICSSWNSGLAILGIQDFTRTKAVAAPGKNCTVWSESNTGYRFTPNGSTSLYSISELLDMSGTVLATADTLTTTPGLLDIRFQNFCPPAGSNQYVVRTSFKSCDNPGSLLTSLDTITINRLNSLGATATTTDATCGPPDGTITVTVPAGIGTPPYTYILDGGAPVTGPSPYTFTGVASGAHSIVVTDNSGGCTNTININVALQGNITATLTKTDAACTGVNNGTITVTSAGGTGPYTFSLNGGAPVPGTIPFSFTNLTPGTYTVLVNDIGTGCTSTLMSIFVGMGMGITANATVVPASCAGINNGSITVTALTGNPPYTWQIDADPAVAGPSPFTFLNLSAGPHTITITDALGCPAFITIINVGQSAGITASITTTQTSCIAATDGTITANATTGVAPFTYSIDGGAFQTGTNPYTFSNVAAGPHVIVVKDAVGCTNTTNVTVAAGPALSVNVTPTATSCNGANNGSILVTPTSGSAPYQYTLDGGAPVSDGANHNFTNLSAGPHTIVVQDAAGCPSNTINVTVAAGATLTATTTPTATSCNGANNGAILVTPDFGTAPFLYTLDGGAPVSDGANHNFTNLSAGPHTIVVQDAAGCPSNTINVTVAAGATLTATTTPTATSCNGANNGAILVTPDFGTAPFLYTLDGGAPVSDGANHNFTNLSAGPHTIVVQDAAGCPSNTINVTITTGPQLTTTATATDALCNGDANGVITVATPTIGTAPYQYSLDNVTWQGSNIFNGLTAGNYTVYFKEAAGCQGSLTITVNEPNALTASTTQTAVVCNGENNGIINITTNGGVTPYQYSIDGGLSWQSSNIFNVAAGTYTVTIKDANNCTTTQTVNVTEPALLTASSVNGAATCNGGNDGVITITALGGNAGYTYSIDGVTFQTSNVFNVLQGNYTVTVKDALGCTTTFNTTVSLNNNLTLTPQTDPTICESKSVQLNLVSNATTYSWSPAASLSNPNIANPVANPTTTTQYIVTATLGNCIAYDTVLVRVNTAPIPDAGPDGAICYGQIYQLQGGGGVQYTWTPSTYLDFTNIQNPTSTPSKTITYTLTKVIDGNGCESLTTDDVTIDVTPPIKVTTSPYDTIGYPGDQFMITATPNVSNVTTYTWSPSFGLSDATIPNPIATVGPIGSDVLYQIKVSTAAGCKGEGYVNIKVYNGPELYTPSGFTPNGDGLNDRFFPFPVGIRSLNYFRVYNRWGQLVYSTTTLMNGWDGKVGGVNQASGTFVFMAEGVDKNGKKITKKGTVTLIR